MKDALDPRLLTLLMHNPSGVVKGAVSLGLAIGTELSRRKQLPLLTRFTVDKRLHDSAIGLALAQWADSAVDDDLTERQFQSLCDRIAAIASAS